MMTPQFSRPLQTALHDTIGEFRDRAVSFDKVLSTKPLHGPHVAGYASIHGRMDKKAVFDTSCAAPDVGSLPWNERTIWVEANSVYGRRSSAGIKRKVIRPVDPSELLAIWDYEGKYESRNWDKSMMRAVTAQRLASPPAKMLRSFAFTAEETLLSLTRPPPTVSEPLPPPGKTSDVPFNPMEEATATRVKAAQADGAEVDLSQWAEPEGIETPERARARVVLRRFAAKWWAYHQEQVAMRWIKSQGNRATKEDIDAINDCIRRAKGTTYWSWDRGSRIFFWKIPPEWREDFRDGVRFWKLTKPPKGYLKNMEAPSREAELVTRLKIFKLKFQYYIDQAETNLLIPRFIVPKVVLEDGTIVDVRCVWDCSINGHNATVYAPGFMLPTALDAEDQVVKWLSMAVAQYLRLGCPTMDYTQDASIFIKTKQGDIDVGQQFNNFRVHPVDQHTLGVRYIYTNNEGNSVEKEAWFRFNCCPFGHKCSPYICVQGESRILELCKGDPRDPKNEFQFATCHLNLPFSNQHDPSMPRVMLLREDGELATTEVTFVDDIRVAGRAKDGEFDHATAATKQVKSRMNSFANQADDRKYRQPSLRSGAWSGLIIHTDTPFPRKSTTAKKWDKFKRGLSWVVDSYDDGNGFVDTGKLRSVAGLGVNITDVYSSGRPFLKGFFNAIEAWRLGRDVDGWRLNEIMLAVAEMDGKELSHSEFKKGYPVLTRITFELFSHAQALLRLFVSESPLMVPLRPTDAHKIRYVVGDASAEGFSIITQYPDLHIDGRDGLWDEDFAEGGSNLREAQNFANHLLLEIRSGKHDGCAVWAATDNAVWSQVWHKGMASVRHLFS
ncbi:hypothetical protein ACHAXR_006517 [Thalassiosira sp. AJA248-18]